MSIWFFLLLGVLLITAFFVWVLRSFQASIEKQFEHLSAKTMRESIETILALTANSLEEKTRLIQELLAGNEKSVNTMVSEIQSQVKTYQQEIKSTEQDRVVKFSEIVNVASRLSLSTEKLGKILSTNNLRGQWGERIADDMMKTSGLLENTHYVKNKQLETSLNRPDFTFFLPDEHKINMDVKFPINNFMRAQETEDLAEQKRFLKDFETDVKSRIQELTKRDYINPEENTVDFAILFVPSESVYAAIYSNCSSIFEYAEERKIILAAPFTLIAILKIITQSFRHFFYERKIRDIVALIEKLGDDLERFGERFSGFDDQMKKMKKSYDEIAETSFKSIRSKIAKIEQYKLGAEKENPVQENEPENTLSHESR